LNKKGNKKIEKEKFLKEEFREETARLIANAEETVRTNFLRSFSLTEKLGECLTQQKSGKSRGSSGSRSDSGVVHTHLETIVRKRIAKTKMDLDKAISIIPICTGKKDTAEFINACEIALKDISEVDKPLLLKIITSKLTGNALEVTKYRNLETWEAIKSILEGTFEHKERALSVGLNTARMTQGETVAKFASRIEKLYYKLCAASTVSLSKTEALTVKNQTKKQAMIIFMTGLPNHLYTVLKARNPATLEECIKLALDEELEYNSKLNFEKIQENVEKLNINSERQGGSSDDAKRQNDVRGQVFNRGGNGYANQNGRNNNFNNRGGYNNGYNRNINRGGYNSFNTNTNNRGLKL